MTIELVQGRKYDVGVTGPGGEPLNYARLLYNGTMTWGWEGDPPETEVELFWSTADDTGDILVRLSSGTDAATPNANAIQLSNLSNLALLTGDDAYREQCAMLLDSFAGDIANNLVAHTGLLGGAMDLMNPQHVVIVGSDGREDLERVLVDLSIPGALHTSCKDSRETSAIWADGKTALDGKATAYACLGPQCAPPVTEPHDLIALLKQRRATVR